MLNKKFVFAVSLVAMMAVSNAWASEPVAGETVSTKHSVFTAYTPTEKGSMAGIAGVTYVNRAVNSAGNAAIAAENHAAASGAYAIDAKSAADRADSAAAAAQAAANAAQQTASEGVTKANAAQQTANNNALEIAKKVNIAQGSTAVNKAVITDASGNVTTGTIATGMITDGAVTSAKIANNTILNANVANNAAIAQSKIAGLTDALDLKGTKVTTTDETSGKSAAELNALYPSVSYLNTVTQKLTDGVNDQINDLSQDVEDLKGTAAELGNLAFEDTVTSALITDGAVTSAKIADKTIVNADVADDAAIAASKIAGLATVATSGSYSDLSGKPAINNATLTIKKNGTSVGTFTANASADNEINITVPTTVASLTDAGSYATVTAMNAADAKKVNVAQETENAIMTTDASGNVAPVAIVDAGSGTYVTDVVVDAGKVTLSRANGPTVNNATLTIKKNGTSVGTFTANASANKEIDITVPTTVASLTDAGSYATVAAMNAADAKKVNVAQETENAIMTTDASGNVAPVAIVDAGSGTYVTDVVVDAGKVTLSRANGPTVNNATLTIKKNGTSVGTFTANASANKEIDIAVPTTVASLTDAGSYATVAAMNAADAKKVNIAQGSTAVNKAVITDASGNVTTGTIATGMITDGAVTSDKIADNTILNANVANNAAIAQSKIAGLTEALDLKGTKVTTTDETSGKSAAELNALYPSVSYLNTVTQKLTDGVNDQINDLSQDVEDLKGTAAELGDLAFEDTVTSALITDGAVATVDIKDEAVTAGKTSGVIGKIPSGSATASTYADIWVE